MNNFINEKLLPPVMKFVNTKAVTAIKNGMLYPIPFIVIGAVFLILGQFPIQAVQDYLNEIGLGPIFMQANNASFGIMALFAVFGIAYSWVRDEGHDAVPAGMLAIVVDIILQPDTVKSVTSIANPERVSTAWQVSGVIDKAWLGGKGMIVAIIVGLLVGWSYSWFMKKGFTIKLPEQVPANVAASFTALIPGAAIVTVATAIYGIFKLGFNTTMVEWIYATIQTPLQHATDGPLGVVVVAFLPVFLWFFGVHGATIVGGIMTPLLLANNADNLALYKAGKLTLDNGAHIVTQAFMDQFITVTGSGMTIGLVIFMLVRAKSVQMKTLGKLEIVPALFNINEPILFGLPLVLNPLLAIPFILTPLVSGFATYAVIAMGIIPPFNGMYVPWTTPAIVSGLIVGGWQGALWQAVMLVMTGFMYYPFARKYDKVLLAEEQGDAQPSAADIEKLEENPAN
ncbi:PTS sugar transporter subunit IIC [Weissella cibaria]|jgi:PTS system cellobiose-specific IIC component|uniref:Permease IIC component n=1 Tax=Weissella cibaria TaxID=137591 RepID=A0A1X4JKR1_9LACO|nr:PTS sugar transporter subunit IIC [Weissella cibaria]AVO65571.1 PTS sugar transporter subunit IIC [Weissella cibaria]MBA5962425.1 PTS sugar transporter subunit IIC [Weissella cibaria]MBU7544794.1 PTS sugar transporter subunit IIC [Weissella cibaria]MCA1356661.1 PTS sugar transporter subunit IIC [Weissella cibaria]MCT0012292.1 PTS sugar transporter subunit IIC [Weissella cibaria]